MNLGLNIFAFGVNYNIETTENKASYFTNSDQLQQLISDFFSNKLVSNSDSMYTIAKRRYLWSIITEKYSNVFQS
jgi:hypothetical protein